MKRSTASAEFPIDGVGGATGIYPRVGAASRNGSGAQWEKKQGEPKGKAKRKRKRTRIRKKSAALKGNKGVVRAFAPQVQPW